MNYIKGKLASSLDRDDEWMSTESLSRLHQAAAAAAADHDDDAEQCSSTFDLRDTVCLNHHVYQSSIGYNRASKGFNEPRP